MRIDVPGYREINIEALLLDYNGTIAVDGLIRDSVRDRLKSLSQQMDLYVLTADTHGTARKQCEGLDVTVHTFPVGNAADEKADFIRKAGGERCACLGNGRNDILMFREAALSIGIMDQEGACAALLKESDLCVTSTEDGLDLLLCPKRIIAGLRG